MTKGNWPSDQPIPAAQKDYETAKEIMAELLNTPDINDKQDSI
jgi:hypothetical protein